MKLPIALLAGLVLALAGCQTVSRMWPGGSDAPEEVSASEVDATLARSEQLLAADDTQAALDWARAAAKARGLTTEERNRVQAWLERVAGQRIDELAREHEDPKALAELYELDLPRQLAVSAGIEAARLWVEQGKLERAFRFLKEIDTRYPLHHERKAASQLLFQIGMALIEKDSGFLWFSGSKDEGVLVLEYLVLNAPWESRCDLAYAKLAEVYEDEDRWQDAIDRHEDLILYHPESALRPYSQARVPHLRLAGLASPEYDRGLLTSARKELEDWLRTYAGSAVPSDLERGAELELEVRLDLTDCLRRLTQSDLGIAHFYQRVDNAFGARYHAERALASARLAADTRRESEARELLANLPRPTESTPGPIELPEEGQRPEAIPEQEPP